MGEEGGNVTRKGASWVETGLEAGIVPGKGRIGVLGRSLGRRGTWAGSSDLGTVSGLRLTRRLLFPLLFDSWS